MKKVAIVDDEHDILNILSQFFNRSKKFEIELFSNPKKAIEKTKAGEFDLVLLDIMMPQMDGIDFLIETKQFSPDTKVLMMTSYSTQDRIVECKKNGADDYVTKPFLSLRELEDKVVQNLGI